MTKLRMLAITLVIASVGLSSCKKTPKTIGDNLQPQNSYIKVFSSEDRDIVALTQHVDSLLTSTSTTLLIGCMHDDIFGISLSQTFTQISPTVIGQVWGDNAVADSIVLQLSYNGFHGDTTTYQTFVVRELDEAFTDSTKCYSNTLLAVKDNILAEYTFQPHPNKYSNIDDDSLTKAVLRIPLDISLGQSFIENEDKFETLDGFLDFFKGLNISCQPDIPMLGSTGATCFFDATNSYTYVRLYYHNDTDTLSYDFNITSDNKHFCNYSHDYEAAMAPINFNDSTDSRYLYVQGIAGVMTWIKFPNIASWAKSFNTNVLINEAKLIMKGAPESINGATNDTATFTPPAQLIIAKKTGEGTYAILDDQYVGSEYYGGQYDSRSGTVYFRLNSYIQNLILDGPDAENLGLYIYVNAGSYTPRRWIFNGPDYQDIENNLRLELTYSLIDTE